MQNGNIDQRWVKQKYTETHKKGIELKLVNDLDKHYEQFFTKKDLSTLIKQDFNAAIFLSMFSNFRIPTLKNWCSLNNHIRGVNRILSKHLGLDLFSKIRGKAKQISSFYVKRNTGLKWVNS